MRSGLGLVTGLDLDLCSKIPRPAPLPLSGLVVCTHPWILVAKFLVLGVFPILGFPLRPDILTAAVLSSAPHLGSLNILGRAGLVADLKKGSKSLKQPSQGAETSLFVECRSIDYLFKSACGHNMPSHLTLGFLIDFLESPVHLCITTCYQEW